MKVCQRCGAVMAVWECAVYEGDEDDERLIGFFHLRCALAQ